MKLSLALVSIFFAVSTNAPAFAQDWDMQPAAAPQAFAAREAVHQCEEAAPVSTLGFDMSGMCENALGNTTHLTGSMDNVPHTTGRTGKQAISSLPLCRTHTLSKISGPIAANGLPPCSLDSFVKNSGFSDQIYGDEGRDKQPPLNDFQSINSGIKGDSAAGLTTGQAL